MIQQLDWQLLNGLQQICHTKVGDVLMPWISSLSNHGEIWILLALALLCTKKYRRVGICIGISLLIGFLLGNIVLKNLIARPRPCDLQPWVALLVPNPTDYSFPSGHSLASFAAATALFCFEKRWGAAAYILAALIAFSRLYLFVHFPSDVICGSLLGIAIGAAVSYGCRRWQARRPR